MPGLLSDTCLCESVAEMHWGCNMVGCLSQTLVHHHELLSTCLPYDVEPAAAHSGPVTCEVACETPQPSRTACPKHILF